MQLFFHLAQLCNHTVFFSYSYYVCSTRANNRRVPNSALGYQLKTVKNLFWIFLLMNDASTVVATVDEKVHLRTKRH